MKRGDFCLPPIEAVVDHHAAIPVKDTTEGFSKKKNARQGSSLGHIAKGEPSKQHAALHHTIKEGNEGVMELRGFLIVPYCADPHGRQRITRII